MSAPQSDAFKKAVVDSKKLVAKPSNDELLELYGELTPLCRPVPASHAPSSRDASALHRRGTGITIYQDDSTNFYVY